MMQAQLMWTINDFLAYTDLLGWPTRGVKACPCCMHSTRFKRLQHKKKFCYMGHRRYLPVNHLCQRNKRTFDGNQEFECAPDVPSGDDILMQLEGMVFGDESAGKKPKLTGKSKTDNVGKKQKKRKKTPKKQKQVIVDKVWKKKSIFFRLLYWKDNLLRHNLDVMHIEKNVIDNILGTLLDIKGKTKDNLTARKDLEEMGLRPTIHPFT